MSKQCSRQLFRIPSKSVVSSQCYFSNLSENVQKETRKARKLLSLESINPALYEIEKQVRSWDVEAALKKFNMNIAPKNMIKANFGDAQSMGVKPITFVRQVIACVSYPKFLQSDQIPTDVKRRVEEILESCSGKTVGCYSPTGGLNIVRKHCAEYITQRDGGIEAYPENILAMNGATESIAGVFRLFADLRKTKTGVMIPIPQYPLYSALLRENNFEQINYFLNQDQNWAISIEELEKTYEQASKQSIEPKVLVIINPGNPTGQVLTKENIEDIIDFAYRHDLFIMADEVYQDNIYDKNSKFHSFKKVLTEMGEPYCNMELASFHSASKGYVNECGLRAGYVELHNFDQEVLQTFVTALSIKMCSTVMGQAGLDCLVSPPQPQDESFELWHKEKLSILDSLKKRASIFEEELNSINGISCNPVQGSMFAFSKIELPRKAIEHAKTIGMEPDFFYTTQLLLKTGICVLPGSTFGQIPGTYHFRTSILPEPDLAKDMLKRLRIFHTNFIEEYK